MIELAMLPAALRLPLQRLRHRRWVLNGLRTGLLTLTVLLGSAFLLGWVDLLLVMEPASRQICMALVLAGSLALAAGLLLRARREGAALALAEALDRAGATGGQIRAGVELAGGGTAASSASSALTGELTQMAIRLSADLARQQDLRRAQPAKPVLRLVIPVSAATLLLALAWLIWPEIVSVQAARLLDPGGGHLPPSAYRFQAVFPVQVVYGDPFQVQVTISRMRPNEAFHWVIEQEGRKPWRAPLIERGEGRFDGSLSKVVQAFRFHIEGPRGQSETFQVGLLTTPRIHSVVVRLAFPEYTRLPAFRGPLPQDGIAGVKNTQVELWVESNRPLRGGSLTLEPLGGLALEKAKPIPLVPVPAQPTVVRGGFLLDRDLSFSVAIEDIQRLPSREPLSGRATLIADRPPSIAIVEPPPESMATPDITLPVVLEGEDDFGITEITLFRSLNGSREIPRNNPYQGELPLKQRLVQDLPLAEWGLQPGDRIEIRAQVKDNDPAGVKTAQTGVHRVEIISKERYLELLRQQETIDDLYERYAPWLERLAELRKKWELAAQGKDPKQLAEAQAALREAIQQLEEQLKEPEVFEADQIFSEELKALLETLKQAQDQAEAETDRFEGVERLLAEGEERLEKNLGMPLEILRKLYRLMEDQRLYEALSQIQEDIQKRLEPYKDRERIEDKELKDRAALQALEEEQHQTKEALSRLVQQIRDHASQLPEDQAGKFKKLKKSALEFATRCHEAGIEAAQEKTEASLGDRKGKESHQRAGEAAEKMKSLLRQAEGQPFGGQSEQLLEEFAPALHRTAQQLGNGKGRGMRGGRTNQSNRKALYGQSKTRRGGGGPNKSKSKQGGPGHSSGQQMDPVKGFNLMNIFDDGSSTGAPVSALPGEYRTTVRNFQRRVVDKLGGQ